MLMGKAQNVPGARFEMFVRRFYNGNRHQIMTLPANI